MTPEDVMAMSLVEQYQFGLILLGHFMAQPAVVMAVACAMAVVAVYAASCAIKPSL